MLVFFFYEFTLKGMEIAAILDHFCHHTLLLRCLVLGISCAGVHIHWQTKEMVG